MTAKPLTLNSTTRTDTCETCRYYETPEHPSAFCRRYPPQPNYQPVHPVVYAKSWCGEHRAKDEPGTWFCNCALRGANNARGADELECLQCRARP